MSVWDALLPLMEIESGEGIGDAGTTRFGYVRSGCDVKVAYRTDTVQSILQRSKRRRLGKKHKEAI
jgi:hypothetical protein